MLFSELITVCCSRTTAWQLTVGYTFVFCG